MALTLVEAAKYSKDKVKQGVVKLIAERSPMIQYIPWKTIDGNAYTYNVEQSLPGIAFRAVGDTYPNSTGVINPVTERLVILGGEVVIDNFIINTQGNVIDIKKAQYAMKARAMGLVFSEQFFESDSTTDIRKFDGLRARLTGTQVQEAGVNGAALTLLMLDAQVDAVIGSGDGDTSFFLNKTLRRKIMDLARNLGGGHSLLENGRDNLGKPVVKYAGIPLHIIERDDNEFTFLDFDETQGSSGVTSSIYLVRFGDNYVSGIQGKGGSMEVKDFGETEAAPVHLGRIEWYVGLCLMHPRCAVRLKGITNA